MVQCNIYLSKVQVSLKVCHPPKLPHTLQAHDISKGVPKRYYTQNVPSIAPYLPYIHLYLIFWSDLATFNEMRKTIQLTLVLHSYENEYKEAFHIPRN